MRNITATPSALGYVYIHVTYCTCMYLSPNTGGYFVMGVIGRVPNNLPFNCININNCVYNTVFHTKRVEKLL